VGPENQGRFGVMILMGANSLLGPLDGLGLENLDFFGPKWHLLRSLPFQGPIKSRFSRPSPSNGPSNEFAPIKIITPKRPIKTGILVILSALVSLVAISGLKKV
jgi:hypothetical protein